MTVTMNETAAVIVVSYQIVPVRQGGDTRTILHLHIVLIQPQSPRALRAGHKTRSLRIGKSEPEKTERAPEAGVPNHGVTSEAKIGHIRYHKPMKRGTSIVQRPIEKGIK